MDRSKKQKANYLDYIPKQNVLFPYRENEKGNVEIARKNRGLFNRIAQLFFRRPKVSAGSGSSRRRRASQSFKP